jgi:DNA-binding transcriptional LysR family regulator
VRRDADLAIRMVRPTQVGLVTRHIGAITVGLFATKAYLAAHEPPTKLSELRDHALIGGDRDRSIVDVLAHAGLETRSSDYALRSDNQLAQLAAVRAGIGIGPVQVPLAARDPALRRVLPKFALPLDTWVVMHEDLRGARRVRTVFDHVVAGLLVYREHRHDARPQRH